MTSNIDDNAADQPATGVGDSDETTAGPANDETVVVADSGQTQLGWLAWSEGDDPDESEPGRESWRAAWGTAALLAVSLTALAVAVGFGLWAIFRIDADRTPGWTPPSIQPAASLPPISTPAPTSTVTLRAAAPTVTVTPPPRNWAAPKTSDPDVVPPPTTVTVQAQPSAPSRDDEFIERLEADKLVLHDRAQALAGAHWVCRQLAAGRTQADIVAASEPDNPTVTHLGMVDFVSASADFYCPQYAGN
jgi:hypothetical protein